MPTSTPFFRALFNYLISDQSFDLKLGLTIKVTVLGIKHQTQWLKKTKAKLGQKKSKLSDFENQLFGSGRDDSNISFFNKHIFQIPRGTKKIPDLFENKCLPIAITVSWLYNLAFEKNPKGDQKILDKLKGLHDKRNATRQHKSAMYIIRCCENILKKVPDLDLSSGPFSLQILSPLCQALKIQVIIVGKLFPQRILHMTPETADPKRMKVFLYDSCRLSQEGTIRHLDVLLRPDGFFEKKKAFRVCCLAYLRPKARHKCHLRQTCKWCKKVMLNKDDYVNHLLAKKVCLRQWKSDLKPVRYCDTCDQSFQNQACFSEHTKHQCFEFYKCHCGRTMRTRKRKSDDSNDEDPLIKRSKKECQCNFSRCKVCYELLEQGQDEDLNHSCKFKTYRLPTWYPRYVRITNQIWV